MVIQPPGELEKIYGDLERSLAKAPETEKDAIREAWLKKHDVMKDMR